MSYRLSVSVAAVAACVAMGACGGRSNQAGGTADAGVLDAAMFPKDASAASDAQAGEETRPDALVPGDEGPGLEDGGDSAASFADGGACPSSFIVNAQTNVVCNCGLEASIPIVPGMGLCPGSSTSLAVLKVAWSSPGALATVEATAPWTIVSTGVGALQSGGLSDVPSDTDATIVVSNTNGTLTVVLRAHMENHSEEGGVWEGSVTILSMSLAGADAG
jgi:hypothetical protein